MTWVRLDDHFDEHPKIAKVGGFGMAVQIAGLAYCNRNLTDGFIPRGVVPGLVSWEVVDEDSRVWVGGRTCGMVGDDLDNRWIAGLLVGAGMWHDEATITGCERCNERWPTNQRHGYLIHDYPDYQLPADEVMAKREHIAKVRSEAGRKGASSRWRSEHGKSGANQKANPKNGGNQITNPSQPDSPVPVPEVKTPLPPAELGDEKLNPRANGTSPRQIADRKRADALTVEISECPECSGMGWLCARCARRQTAIADLLSKAAPK